MAITNLTVQKLNSRNTFSTAADFTGLTAALDATDGAKFEFSGNDDKVLVLVHNTNATGGADPLVVTVKAGDGIQGTEDISVSLANGKFALVVLESGRFKNVTGTLKGCVKLLSTSTYIKAAVFQLP